MTMLAIAGQSLFDALIASMQMNWRKYSKTGADLSKANTSELGTLFNRHCVTCGSGYRYLAIHSRQLLSRCWGEYNSRE